jgi:hypothetical protein
MAKPMEGEKSSKFSVEFRGIKLPPEVEKRIASEIQQVVVRNVAELDLPQGVEAVFPGIRGPIWKGIIIRPPATPIGPEAGM